MASPWVSVKLLKVFYKLCSQRVEMDVSDQYQEVWIFLADNRLVPVLEQVAASFMAFVECDRIACHKAAHDFA